MGNMKFIACENCFKKDEEEESQERESKELPRSLVDVKIESGALVRQRTQKVSDVYEKVEMLGAGAFGAVYKVKRVSDNLYRSLKEIPKEHIEGKEDEIKNEVEILKKLDHPNIMKIYEYFEDENNLYLVFEFCDSGDLSKKHDDYGDLDEFTLKFIMYQLFIAVNFLHINKIVHGDIKRENVTFLNTKENQENKEDIFEILSHEKKLTNELNKTLNIEDLSDKAKELLEKLSKYEVKLIDFGSAKVKRKSGEKLSGVIGTTYYCSPEVVEDKYGLECDEWSCGVMMYILLSGYPPFNGETEEEVFERICKDKVDLNIPELKHVSKYCKDLISKLLEKDPKKRIKASEALEHDFFKHGISIKEVLEGKKEENQNVLKTFAKSKSKRFGGNETKISKFKEIVIAYITLNFADKTEEKQVKDIFRQLSGGDDNFILTKKTFEKNMADVCKDFTPEEITKLFETIDENNSDTIEYQELMRALADHKKLLCDKNLKEAFKFFDQDQNGTISWNEIADVVFEGNSVPENIVQEFLDEIGQKDVNLRLDYDEFVRILTE